MNENATTAGKPQRLRETARDGVAERVYQRKDGSKRTESSVRTEIGTAGAPARS